MAIIESEFHDLIGPNSSNLTSTTPNFFEWFMKKYIGTTIHEPCTIDKDGPQPHFLYHMNYLINEHAGCAPLQAPCTDVTPGPYSRQAFLVLNAMISKDDSLTYKVLC